MIRIEFADSMFAFFTRLMCMQICTHQGCARGHTCPRIDTEELTLKVNRRCADAEGAKSISLPPETKIALIV